MPTAPRYENIATAVFTQPPIGTVGMTEAEAVSALGDVDVFMTSFRAMKHTVSGREEKTFMKVVVDSKTDKARGRRGPGWQNGADQGAGGEWGWSCWGTEGF